MRKLYYNPVCVFSRQAKILFQELNVSYNAVKEDFWIPKSEFININPAGTLPVLVEQNGLVVCGIYPLIEYLYEKYPGFSLMSDDINIKCEIRRLISWFNEKFYREVTRIFIDEKVLVTFIESRGPNSKYLNQARKNFINHMHYLTSLLIIHSFIASDVFSCADIVAGCHISILDYFNEINWNNWPNVRHWYAILKSRPSFRSILQDKIPGFIPSTSYLELDF